MSKLKSVIETWVPLGLILCLGMWLIVVLTTRQTDTIKNQEVIIEHLNAVILNQSVIINAMDNAQTKRGEMIEAINGMIAVEKYNRDLNQQQVKSLNKLVEQHEFKD